MSLMDMSLPEIFDEGGLLSKVIPGYTPRKPQIQAVATIQKAYENMEHGLIEAGTGTGKSFIVLFAALHWAKANQKKAVLSLPSQILQEQLYKGDVPAVQKMLEYVEEEVKFALAIGRGNFLSLRKVTNLYNKIKKQMQTNHRQTVLTNEEFDQFKKITDALNNPDAMGYKGDVEFVPSDSLWSKVASTTDTCLGEKCPFYEQCYYFKNKKKVADADVIVSNNALLFADMAQKVEMGFDATASLPPYHLLVFDESHNLEKDATNFFKKEISSKELLDAVVAMRNNAELQPYLTDKDNIELQKLISEIKKVMAVINKFLFGYIEQRKKQDYYRKNQEESAVQNEIVLTKAQLNNIEKYFKALELIFAKYLVFMKKVIKKMKDNDNPSNKQILLQKRVFKLIGNIESIVKKSSQCVEYDRENLYFLEKELVEGYMGVDALPIWRLTTTPINLGKTFQKNMFNVCDHVILLSATISTNNNFEFFRSRLGFKPEDSVQELIVDSPFDYPNQGKVYLFENSPDTKMVKEFEDFTADATYKILQNTSGGTFILFTSTAAMKRCYDAIAEKVETELNIKCLMQGQDSKSMIIQRFRDYQKEGSGYKSAILFAGSSFWEGVSVEGKDLQNIIITKLPFPVPTDPIIKARCEFLEEQGINSFKEYLVPLATIPLKQGFGRLIRKITDKGNIFMLDNRLVKAKYKDQILNSLPNFIYNKIKM